LAVRRRLGHSLPRPFYSQTETLHAIREFIEKADSDTRAWFLALLLETQLEVINDSDKYQQIRGRKP
jgi:hypothetical protein